MRIEKGWFIASGIIVVIGIVGIIPFYTSNLTTVAPTEEGVYVSQPYFFGDAEIKKEALLSGRHFVWPADTVIIFGTTPVTLPETFTDIPSSDNVQMDFRIYSKVQLRKGASPRVYEKLGIDWYINAVKKDYRTVERNVVRKCSADELRLDVDKLNESQCFIKADFEELLKAVGAEYDVLSVSIGGITPPDEVLTESARTAAQKQRKKTQKVRAAAEVERAKAEDKAALADQAYMDKMKMTVSEYIQRKAVENQANLIKVIAEKEDVTVIMGNAVPSVSAMPAN